MVSDTRCPALHDCEFEQGEAGQRLRRGRSPVEHRGTFVCSFICLSVLDLRHETADLKPERAVSKSEKGNKRTKRPDLRSERTDLRPNRADLRPDRADEAQKG